MTETVFHNAHVVAGDELFLGSVLVRDGAVAAIDSGPVRAPAGSSIDCEGDYLIPGLVELHTDNLEKHFTPRPGVRWPGAAAVIAHDAQMTAAGVTTVFDAIACGDIIEGSDRLANMTAMVEGVVEAQKRGLLRAEHRLHLRCELSSERMLELFEPFVDEPLVGIVSLMDHAPGQRQFANIDKYREYYQGKYGFSDAEMEAFIARHRAAAERYADEHRRAIAALARERGLILASHDDATPAHVAEAADFGCAFSEFPTTVAAGEAARAAGLKVLMGAPNVVRGGSHSGNVSALSLAAQGCLDILSSDYAPVSLLHGAFLLHGVGGFALPQAIATVTSAPAEAAGLADRGRIEPGRRADLVRVKDAGDVPVVRGVWRGGERVA